MASHYVNEDNRKLKYRTRACSYFIQRITEPTDTVDREYRSIRAMSLELKLSDPAIRKFVDSGLEYQYIRSKQTGILYLLKRPEKDLAITARCIEPGASPYDIQTFTSAYQIVKRFRVSFDTVREMKQMQPLEVECTKPINDEFKRKYLLTFHK